MFNPLWFRHSPWFPLPNLPLSWRKLCFSPALAIWSWPSNWSLTESRRGEEGRMWPIGRQEPRLQYTKHGIIWPIGVQEGGKWTHVTNRTPGTPPAVHKHGIIWPIGGVQEGRGGTHVTNRTLGTPPAVHKTWHHLTNRSPGGGEEGRMWPIGRQEPPPAVHKT